MHILLQEETKQIEQTNEHEQREENDSLNYASDLPQYIDGQEMNRQQHDVQQQSNHFSMNSVGHNFAGRPPRASNFTSPVHLNKAQR